MSLTRSMADNLSVGADLSAVIDYIEHPDVGLEALVRDFNRDELDKVFEDLEEYAEKHSLEWLSDQVSSLKGVEKEKREIQEREVIAEITPVLESAKQAKRRLANDGPALADRSLTVDGYPQARFVIKNLRSTLENINAPMTSFNRQMQLERASYEAAERELQQAAKDLEDAGQKHVVEAQRLQRDLLQAHMFRWQQDLAAALDKDIARMRADVANDGMDAADARAPKWTSASKMKESTLLLYLDVLPAKRLALITILELMRMVGSGGIPDGMKMLRGVLSVGRAVEAEHRADTIRNVAGSDSAVWARTLDPQTHKPSRSSVSSVWNQIGREKEGEALMQPAGGSAMSDLRSVWTPPWSQMVQVNVGAYLVETLMNVAKVPRHGTDPMTGEPVTEEQPAFSHNYEYVRGKKLGVLRLNPVVAQRLANDTLRQVIHPKHLPMLVPPRPWQDWNDGAYLATPVQVMRFKDSIEQVNYIKEAAHKRHLEPVFHGLDVLSSTPWAINRNVFDVILEAWNSGEAIADIPATLEKSVYDIPDKPDPKDTDPVKRKHYIEKLKASSAQQRKDHGERCKYNYNLEIARSYLNDVFYIPHNLDFRGRAYPIPPHLSPVGDDLCRGLLTFGRSKPLGKTGLKWLQIHLANVFGYDKASFEERAAFAKEHEADIFDSADNPLKGKRWWLQAEDPWQCLAVCFDMAKALRSPNPEEYESSLPIHQDGTCNGMQHYAALGGDVRGAKAVNLERGDRPADIYSGVAELVNKSIEEDRQAGIPMALMIEGALGRKVVKQTVMTTVYGVTFIGARDQIAKQLKDRGGLDGDDLYLASSYIARKVLASIGDLFSGAKAIMDWLAISARLISRSIHPDRIEAAATGMAAVKLERDTVKAEQGLEGAPKRGRKKKDEVKPVKASKKENRLTRELMTSVIWTTPLGLPVVQPYRKEAKKQIMTSLQTVYIHDPNAPAEVSPMKQAAAFPPNYIHSLDATHMLLTAVKCHQSGITFASVHDSYWTHASSVESMSEVIRDTFIHLHSQNLIGQLREEFLLRYGDHCVPVVNARQIAQAVKDKKKQKKGAMVYGSEVEDYAAEVDPSELAVDADAADEDLVSEEPPKKLAKDDPTMTAEEIAALSDKKDLPEIQVADQRFVRLRDLIPPAPPRGQFNVERVRASQYFFS